jgi:hypothetical protein
VDWIKLAQDRIQCLARVNTVIKLAQDRIQCLARVNTVIKLGSIKREFFFGSAERLEGLCCVEVAVKNN